MLKIKDLKQGDILTYKNKVVHRVNRPWSYPKYYNDNFEHKESSQFDIMKVQRFKKILFFYILKTIYER